jgi:ferredoxin-NADP reductase
MLYSSRTLEDVIYYQELEQLKSKGKGLEVFHTLTRSQPAGWNGFNRRIDEAMLEEVVRPLAKSLQAFICGPTLLVESVANTLVKFGIKPNRIRTERFGPTGTA